ncbi:MAG: hypothetical protein KGL39_06370 [Patescibacteria group bacterium]|nr:hypothetical protein [Patescibacteria group bacterium]
MGSLCTGSPQQTTSSAGYTPTGTPQINDVWNAVQSAASTPYQSYTGQLVAPTNQQQQAGTNTINRAYTASFPYITSAGNYANSAAQPISAGQISSYMNPYTSSVINATQDQFNTANAQQQSQLLGNAASQGALGGDRSAVAQASLAGQQQLAQAPVIAGLNSQNYSQALAAAQAQQATQLAAAGQLGGLGSTAANIALGAGQAQIGAGTLQQQTQQAQDVANYQQYLQALGYPFQTAQFMATYGLPAATSLGGTQTGSSSTMPSQASPLSQGVGLAMAALPFFAKRGGRTPFANGGVTEYKKNAAGMWEYEPYADGGFTLPTSPFSLTAIPGYVPTPTAPISVSNTMPSISSTPTNLVTPQNPFSFTPQQATGAAQGLTNLMGQLGVGSFNAGTAGGTGLPGFGGVYAKGGIVGIVKEMRHAMKHYDDGGIVADDFAALSPYGIANLPTSIDQVPMNLDFNSAGFGAVPSTPLAAPAPIAAANPVAAPSAFPMASYANQLYGAESSNNPTATNPNSTAGGLAQFTQPTWNDLMNRHPELDLKPNGMFDPAQVSRALPVFTQENQNVLSKYDVPVTPGNTYLAHVFGGQGAANFYTAMQTDPNAPAAQIMPRNVVAANQSLFFGPDGTPLTAAQTYQKVTSRISGAPSNVAAAPTTDLSARSTTPLSISNLPAGTVPPSGQSAAASSTPSGGFLSQLFGGKGLSDNARMALLSAGLGILGSNSPYALQAIGQGGAQGLQTYLKQRQVQQQLALQQQELGLRGQQLAQQAQLATLPYQRPTAAQMLQGTLPRQIGQDILGHPIYGVRSQDGTWRDPITGKPITTETLTGGNIGGTANAQVEPTQMAEWVKSYGQNGAQLLSGYPALVRNNVLGLINGDIDPSKLSYRDRGNYINLASAVDPSFNTYTAPMRAQAAKAFATGKQGDQLRFFNNAVQHLDTLSTLITGLGNGDVQLVNAARNAFKSQFGSVAPNDFNAAKAIVGQEIVKAIVANGGGEREREEAAQQLSAAKSPQQLNGVIDTYKHLMGAQLRDLKQQYNAAGLKNFDKYLIPESQKELANIESPAAAAQMPVKGERKQFKQGWGVWDGTKWVPETPNG